MPDQIRFPIILRNTLLFLFISSGFSLCYGQTKPVISNYSNKLYKAHTQNWGFAQDSRGILYVANNDNVAGLLEFDGSNWRSHSTAHNSSIYSLAIDTADRLYVGGESEFGVFLINEKGGKTYEELSTLLPDSLREFTYVWCTHYSNGKVFFQARELLVVWEAGKMSAFQPDEYFHKSFLVNGEVWVREQGKGFLVYRNNQLMPIKGSEAFAEIKVDFVLPFAKDTLLLGTRSDGLFIFDQRLGLSKRLKTSLDDAWTSYDIYGGLKLNNGYYAIITLSNGLYLLNEQLTLVQHISREDGLQSEKIWGILEDKNQNIWLAMHKGIAMMEAENPISIAQEGAGYSGEINDIIRHQGQLYIATSQGVYRVNEHTDPGLSAGEESQFDYFEPINDIQEICWDLLSDGEDLFVAGNYAVYKIKFDSKRNAQVSTLAEGSPKTIRLFPGKQRMLLVGGGSLLLLKEKTEGNWFSQWEYDELPGEVRDLLIEPGNEQGPQTVWAGVSGDGLYKLTMDIERSESPLINLTKFDSTHRLDQQYFTLSWVRDHFVVGTAKGLVSFNAQKGYFERDLSLGKAFSDSHRQVYKIHHGENGDIMVVLEERLYKVNFGSGDQLRIDSLPYRTLDLGLINGLLLERIGKAWIGGSDGLVHFNINKHKDLKKSYATVIRQASLRSGERLFLGNFFKYQDSEYLAASSQQEEHEIILDYHQNSIVIEYAAIRFESNVQLHYSYQLEGYETSFGDWTPELKATYTNLSPGDYVFKVKARDIYGHESSEAQFNFSINPPWYSTWWFYLIQVSSLLGLVMLSYVANRSGGNSRLSHILTFVTIITIFEFLILFFEGYLDRFSGGVPIFKLIMNVVLAVSLNPLEKLFSRLLSKEEAT